MKRATRYRIGRKDGVILVVVTGIVVATTFLVYSPADVPIVDDWTYAWSVEHYLQTRTLRVLEWSAHYPLAQILWGAVFSWLFGFSFVTLRLSTVVLAWAGLVAFFLTLRELGIRGPLAVLGTLILWCNPVFFVLSHSFMTDVPLVSVMNAAMLFYVRWVKRERARDLFIASALATAAFLIRQIGAVLALVPLGYLLLAPLLGRERRAVPWSQLICLLVPFLGIGLTLGWIKVVHGETRVALEKAASVAWVLTLSGWIYVQELLHALMHFGLVLWPLTWLAVGRLSKGVLGLVTVTLAAVIGLVLWLQGPLPDPLGKMLTWDELGLSDVLITRDPSQRHLPLWGRATVLAVSLSGVVAILSALWDGLRRWPLRVREPATVLLLNTLLQCVLLGVLFLFYDRYYLPLLPGVIALLVGTLRPTRAVIVVGLAGVLLSGTIAVSGTIDQFRRQVAVAEARAWLLRQGVAPENIDAGYALNGWWLYAHPRSGPPTRGHEPDVPWITGWTVLPYRISGAADSPYTVVHRVPWRPVWATSDTVYVLEDTAELERSGLPSLRARSGGTP
jgi:4-amino-4-deoxy-L-arabinose transferase-like glycosyltransferase